MKYILSHTNNNYHIDFLYLPSGMVKSLHSTWYKKPFLLLFLLVIIMNHNALSNSYKSLSNVRFGKISTGAGLSQSSVFSIAQDKKGFIWLGTRDGLNRYDGYEFVTYKYNPQDTNSLSNNEITTMLVDWKGDLWIGTRGGGLNLFSYRNNRFNNIEELTYEKVVRDIYEARDSSLWIGSTQGMLYHPNKKKQEVKSFKNLSANSVFFTEEGEFMAHNKYITSAVSITGLSQDTLMVGTETGLFLYIKSKERFHRLGLGEVSGNVVTSIEFTENGTLWIGSYDGLFKIESFRSLISSLPQSSLYLEDHMKQLLSSRIETIEKDSQDNLWVGTRGRGLA